MIFLTIGNWPGGFDRLVKAVDDLKIRGVIQAPVVAQVGATKYKPSHLETVVDYCSPEQFKDTLAHASVVITHAGVGTIGQAISLHKPVVVVPRKPELGEHIDDHQFTTARQLEAEGKILVAYEVAELPAKLDQAGVFVPAGNCGAEQIVETVEAYLNSLVERKRRR